MKGNPKKIAAIRKSLPEEYRDIRLTDDDFVDALYALMFYKDMPVITIMGPGGTGKSFMYKLYASINDDVLCTATTGIAAFNISNSGIPTYTLHSALKIRALPWYDDSSADMRIARRLAHYSDLLIDEVSMLNANLLDYILLHVEEANAIREAEGKRAMRVVLFGDTLQLPPVIKDTDKNIRKLWADGYDQQYMFFNSWRFKELSSNDSFFFLDEIFRQSDKEFRGMLNEIRFADVSDSTLSRLNEHVCSVDSFRAGLSTGMLYLTTTNKAADRYNEEASAALRAQGAENHEYIADEYGYPDWARYFSNLRKSVELFVGQQVMCIANDPDGNYQNGTLGTIISFHYSVDEDSHEELYYPVVRSNDGREFLVGWHTFSEYRIPALRKGEPVIPAMKGEITQIGCRPAFATTVHKAQGLTLDVIYFDPSRHPMPNCVYVALSRLRSLNGLGLKRKLRKDDVIISDESVELYRRFNAIEPD